MSYKALIPLFVVLATLAIVHSKPSPVMVYIMTDQGLKDATVEKEVVQSHEETSDTETAKVSLEDAVSKELEEAKDSAASDECWWGPGLCYGSQWGN